MLLILFRICNCDYYVIYTYLGHSFYEVEIIFFHKVCLIINAFPPLCETLFAGCVKMFAETLELFMHAVSAHHRQNGDLGVYPSGGQKAGSRRVLNRDCREDEGEQSSLLLPFPRLYADWCVVVGVVIVGTREYSSSSYLAEPLEFVVLTSLVTVHIALHYL